MGRRAYGVDYLICDEACFYTVEQVEQMAELVDRYDVDVFAFGLATDFRVRLFPAAQRLFELADEVTRIQVEVLCWCGREGQLNARVVDGAVAREGEQVVIGDTARRARRCATRCCAAATTAPATSARSPDRSAGRPGPAVPRDAAVTALRRLAFAPWPVSCSPSPRRRDPYAGDRLLRSWLDRQLGPAGTPPPRAA